MSLLFITGCAVGAIMATVGWVAWGYRLNSASGEAVRWND
jgi:hypothetical protein